ncbi:MAG: hypothetical protein ACKPKO_03540 [Candidatus Fonsibacter sp.]
MRTNEDIQDMYDNHGENYITVFFLKRYELVTTYDIEPINPLTIRQRNTQTHRYALLFYQYRIRSVTKDIQRINRKKALY